MTIERGFCLSREYVQSLRDSGLPDKLIWQGGRGAQSTHINNTPRGTHDQI